MMCTTSGDDMISWISGARLRHRKRGGGPLVRRAMLARGLALRSASGSASVRARTFGHGHTRPAEWPGQAHEEVVAQLPEEDLADDLGATVELYVEGSKPRCEEAEYLELLHEAMERFDLER